MGYHGLGLSWVRNSWVKKIKKFLNHRVRFMICKKHQVRSTICKMYQVLTDCKSRLASLSDF